MKALGAIRRVARQRPADRPCVGLQRTCHDAVGVPQPRVGAQGMAGVVIRCRLEPVKRVARMIKRHLDGIVTAVVDKVTNARAESINAGIQKMKY